MQKQTPYNLINHAPLLIVEPNKDLCIKIAKAFQRSGLRLISVGSGEDALNVVRGFEFIPCVGVIELALPDMSGLELASRLKQARTIPIIMSGYNISPDTVASMLDLVAEDFVQKPYDEQELAARVYRILLRSSKAMPAVEEAVGRVRKRIFLAAILSWRNRKWCIFEFV